MPLTRRDFLKTSALVGATAAAAGALRPEPAHADFTALRSSRKLKILILGGTAFLGPAVVEQARMRGHEITLFNRGRTNADMFPDLEKLQGDRDGDLESLKGGKWDVCLDDSGYIPRMVKASAQLLAPNVGQYIFISSISVYADFTKPGLNETSPVATISAEDLAAARTQKDITGANYGALKALCEQAAAGRLPGPHLHHPAGPDRRSARPLRPLHLLAGARGPRRRGAGPGRARHAHADHRRARPGRVHRALHRTGHQRRVQRDQSRPVN